MMYGCVFFVGFVSGLLLSWRLHVHCDRILCWFSERPDPPEDDELDDDSVMTDGPWD